MDTMQAEIETLKSKVTHWETGYRDLVREVDARDRKINELERDNQVLRGEVARMKLDRNAEE